jgi:hypothetical protein
LPAYRYVPGLQPHPLRDPSGHSYRPISPAQPHAAWKPADWQGLPEWLLGVDLFNAFYFWEAHESWEALWSVAPRRGGPALLLQGLIQAAAAMLKIHLQSADAAARLSRQGLDKLARAAATDCFLMGLDLGRTENELRKYFLPLDERTLPRLDASVPVLLLSGERDVRATR